MAEPVVIDVATTFGRFVAGRLRGESPYSGEAFREDVAAPALAAGGDVVFNMDGVMGFPSSFLEEAFGGLIRDAIDRDEDPNALIARIEVVAHDDPSVAEEIRFCMMEAARRYRA